MNGGSASIGHLNPCAHPGCLCQARPGERYCGDFCREAMESTRAHTPPPGEPGRCACGHSACEA